MEVCNGMYQHILVKSTSLVFLSFFFIRPRLYGEECGDQKQKRRVKQSQVGEYSSRELLCTSSYLETKT